MRLLLRTAMVVCVAFAGVAATTPSTAVQGFNQCYICGTLDGGPGHCFGGAIRGESSCVNPCFAMVFDCAIV